MTGEPDLHETVHEEIGFDRNSRERDCESAGESRSYVVPPLRISLRNVRFLRFRGAVDTFMLVAPLVFP